MQCDEFINRLEKDPLQALNPTADFRQHLEACASCQATAEDRGFARLLQLDTVPAPSEGFVDRALQQAWQQREVSDSGTRIGSGKALALVACLVVATAVALTSVWPDREAVLDTGPEIVQIPARGTQDVTFMMVSGEDLPEAFISLRMDENVRLAGYPDSRELRWPAAITAGNNQLTLPVQLQGNDSGIITVAVESRGARKEMMLAVEPLT